MKQALLLLMAMIALLEAGMAVLGGATVLALAFGAVALMALMIAATFLWLWLARATSLALGMVFSWSGIGLLTGWWWLSGLPDRLQPGQGAHLLMIALGFSLSGAILHFAVIQRSFGRHGPGFLWPVGLAFVLSAATQTLL